MSRQVCRPEQARYPTTNHHRLAAVGLHTGTIPRAWQRLPGFQLARVVRSTSDIVALEVRTDAHVQRRILWVLLLAGRYLEVVLHLQFATSLTPE
jgi:hypothetical protein